MRNPKKVDWRKNAAETDFDADDEELSQTPPDVIAQLGFDPANESEAHMIPAAANDAASLEKEPRKMKAPTALTEAQAELTQELGLDPATVTFEKQGVALPCQITIQTKGKPLARIFHS